MRLARSDSRLFTWIRDKKSRRKIYLSLAGLLLCILIIPSWILEKNSRRELASRRLRQAEFHSLSQEYRFLRGQIEGIERRLSLGDTSGIARTIDDVISSLGMRSKMRSVKIIGSRRVSDTLAEETAEVQLEKLTLNELINLLYRIKEARAILLLKRATIKKPFDNPELLNVTMTLALFAKK